jgi:methylmalonyl-CoA epimerase
MPRETLHAFNAEIAFLLPTSRVDRELKKTPLKNNSLDSTNLTAIELLQPIEQKGALWKFLEKRGEGLHHICYEVGDIALEHARLSAAGLHFIDEKPRLGAHGSMVAFIHPKSCHGVLTELVQPARK